MTTCALKPRDKRKMESCRGGGRDRKHKDVTRLKGQRATSQGDRTSVLSLRDRCHLSWGLQGRTQPTVPWCESCDPEQRASRAVPCSDPDWELRSGCCFKLFSWWSCYVAIGRSLVQIRQLRCPWSSSFLPICFLPSLHFLFQMWGAVGSPRDLFEL